MQNQGLVMKHCDRICAESAKGQLNSEWIYEAIVFPKMQTKKLQEFLPYQTNKDRSTIF